MSSLSKNAASGVRGASPPPAFRKRSGLGPRRSRCGQLPLRLPAVNEDDLEQPGPLATCPFSARLFAESTPPPTFRMFATWNAIRGSRTIRSGSACKRCRAQTRPTSSSSEGPLWLSRNARAASSGLGLRPSRLSRRSQLRLKLRQTQRPSQGERGASEPLRKASAVPRKTLQSPSFPLVSGATFLSLRACVSAQDLRPSSRATTARRSLRDALAELGVRNVNPADR